MRQRLLLTPQGSRLFAPFAAELLGKGGFGEVWKARHIHQSRKKPVALKFCLDPVAAATLRNEAALHDHLDRVREEASAPGIVPLLETYLRSDPPCLMYEYIESGDLLKPQEHEDRDKRFGATGILSGMLQSSLSSWRPCFSLEHSG